MFLVINFVSNNFFGGYAMSQNSCAMMHGPSTYFHHIGFWLIFIVLIVFAVLAYRAISQPEKTEGKKRK